MTLCICLYTYVEPVVHADYTPVHAQQLMYTSRFNKLIVFPVCLPSPNMKQRHFFYRWNEETFGPHFSASPVEGIVAPLTETGIEVVFTPKNVDDDIRREGVLCMVEVRARRATHVKRCERTSFRRRNHVQLRSAKTLFSLTTGLCSSFDPEVVLLAPILSRT